MTGHFWCKRWNSKMCWWGWLNCQR